jgi:Arylsulfotransferase (ASST)
LAAGVALLAAGLAALALSADRARAAVASGPTCAPAQLNVSDVLPGTPLAVSPLPGSLDASPGTQISFLGAPAGAIAAVAVTGSRSGPHAGTLRPYSQGDGASFVPAKPFAPGEHVAVAGTYASGSGPVAFSFSFNVSVPDPLPRTPVYHPAGEPSATMHFRSRSDLLAPNIVVTRRSVAPGGYIFADPANGPGPSGPMIFDDLGNLVYFHPIPTGEESTNLQVQQLEGQPVLTWWQGYVPPQGFGIGEEIVVGQNYRSLFHVHAGNGFAADLHDFHLTTQGTALLTVFNPIDCNLAPYGGRAYSAVTDGVFQELDLHTGLVRREWHSLDHVRVADSYNEVRGGSIVWPFDYFHVNSVDPSTNGSFVVSARNTWAVYEVNRETGQVVTTLGGKSSGISLQANGATAYQHDAEPHGANVISVFDNGGTPPIHHQSRGIIIDIDAAAHSAEVVAEFTHPTPLLSGSQGSIQLLPSGDEFIGWGAQPYFSEFSPSGKLVFDAHMPAPYESYRAYRFTWTGAPAAPPDVAAGTSRSGREIVYASWDGDTRTTAWRVIGGSSPRHLHRIGGSRRAGFETAILLRRRPTYLAVQALSAGGTVLGTSRTIRG